MSLLDCADGSVVDQSEWFYATDTVPPLVSNYRAMVLDNRAIAIRAVIGDEHSGVDLEAITTSISIDSGQTWREYGHVGFQKNIDGPTVSWTVVGPFRSGDVVWLAITAYDRSGNANRRIPDDATMFEGPAHGSALLVEGSLPWDATAVIFEPNQQAGRLELESDLRRRLRLHSTDSLAGDPLVDMLLLDERDKQLMTASLRYRQTTGVRLTMSRMELLRVTSPHVERHAIWEAVIP